MRRLALVDDRRNYPLGNTTHMLRLNLGCGRTPTPGWGNYDNSWSVRLAPWPRAAKFLARMGMLNDEEAAFIAFARHHGIQWADATRRIPAPSGSVEVIYSSHMVEHLDRDEASRFLTEVRRVLKPGGIVRLAIPDIRHHVNNYLEDQDADKFIDATRLTTPRPGSLFEKLRFLLLGNRNHLWMYDGASLCKFLLAGGFMEPTVYPAGLTSIHEPGDLNLRERAPESAFVEATNP